MSEPIVAVFGASRAQPGDPVWDDGERLGRMLVEAGARVVTGGYAGLMEAVSKGAAEAGGTPIGITAPSVFPNRPGANGHVQEELVAATIAERIARIVDIADAAIALPGSLGTLAELIVAWNAAFVAPFRKAMPLPVIAVGATWRDLIDRIAIDLDADASFVSCVDDVDAAAHLIESHVRGSQRRLG